MIQDPTNQYMLPNYQEQTESLLAEIRGFLDLHRVPNGIFLMPTGG